MVLPCWVYCLGEKTANDDLPTRISMGQSMARLRVKRQTTSVVRSSPHINLHSSKAIKWMNRRHIRAALRSLSTGKKGIGIGQYMPFNTSLTGQNHRYFAAAFCFLDIHLSLVGVNYAKREFRDRPGPAARILGHHKCGNRSSSPRGGSTPHICYAEIALFGFEELSGRRNGQ